MYHQKPKRKVSVIPNALLQSRGSDREKHDIRTYSLPVPLLEFRFHKPAYMKIRLPSSHTDEMIHAYSVRID